MAPHWRRRVRFYFTVNFPITQKTFPKLLSLLFYLKLLRIKGNDLALSDACTSGMSSTSSSSSSFLLVRFTGLESSPAGCWWTEKEQKPKPTDERIMIFKVNKWCIWAFYLLRVFFFFFCCCSTSSSSSATPNGRVQEGWRLCVCLFLSPHSEFMAFNLSRHKTL